MQEPNITAQYHTPDPPKGTHALTIEDLRLPVQVDMTRALMNSALCFFSYRKDNEAYPNADNTLQDAKRIDKIAKQFGYHSYVVTTSSQQAVIYYNDYEAIVAFEGSKANNWRHYFRNLNQLGVTAPPPFAGNIHAGFWGALNNQVVGHSDAGALPPSLYSALRDKLAALHQAHPEMQLHLTGHSAGGAIAAIAATRLSIDLPSLECQSIYTFGQPRFSDRAFKNSSASLLGKKLFRFEQYGDPMPALPFYHKEHHVHCGLWLPMDDHGHFLGMNDHSIIEDTLSRSNEYETLSSWKNLLNVANYDKHRIAPYSFAIHRYLAKHSAATDLRSQDVLHQDALLWQLQALHDQMDDVVILLPEQERGELWQLREKFDGALKQWEQMHTHPARVFYGDEIAHDNPALRKAAGGKSAAPESFVKAQTISRSRLFETNALEIERLLYEYQAILKTALRETPLIASTNTMIDSLIDSLRLLEKNAPEVYPKPSNAIGIA